MPSPTPDDPDLCPASGSECFEVRGEWVLCPLCTRALKPFPKKKHLLRPHRVRGRKTRSLDTVRDVLAHL